MQTLISGGCHQLGDRLLEADLDIQMVNGAGEQAKHIVFANGFQYIGPYQSGKKHGVIQRMLQLTAAVPTDMCVSLVVTPQVISSPQATLS